MKKKYSITGIDCANCAAKLEAKMNELPEVESVTLSFTTQQLYVEAENPDEAVKALQALADKVEPGTEIGSLKRGKRKAKAHSHEHHHHHDDDGDCCCGHDHDHEHHHHDHDDDGDCCCGYDHDHEHHHHHHGHDADEVFTSWGEETPVAFSHDELDAILKKLCEEDSGLGVILRSKGVVKAKDNEKWYYFDLVAGEYEIRLGEPDYTGKVCVIGSKINEEKIAALFFGE